MLSIRLEIAAPKDVERRPSGEMGYGAGLGLRSRAPPPFVSQP